MAEVSIAEYCKIYGKSPSGVRHGCIEGRYKTARKVGRNWVLDSEEKAPIDNRVKHGHWKGFRHWAEESQN